MDYFFSCSVIPAHPPAGGGNPGVNFINAI